MGKLLQVGDQNNFRKEIEDFRLIVIAVGFLCLASVCSNYIVINFTFICMKNDNSEVFVDGNGVRLQIFWCQNLSEHLNNYQKRVEYEKKTG